MTQAQVPRHVLPVLVLAQFAGTSLWFAVNAVMPDLQRELGWPTSAVGTLTSALQFGFILGTLVFRAAGDRRPVFATPRVPGLCAGGRRMHGRRLGHGEALRRPAGLALCDRLLPRRHLPGGHEDRLAVVHARPRPGAGLPDRRAGAGLGQCARAARDRRRPALAHADAGRGRAGGRRGRHAAHAAARCARRRGPRHHPAVESAGHHRHRPARAQLGAGLLRSHVGALHPVGADAADPGDAAGRHCAVVGRVLGAGLRRDRLRGRRLAGSRGLAARAWLGCNWVPAACAACWHRC